MKHFAQELQLETHRTINVFRRGTKVSSEEGSLEDKSSSGGDVMCNKHLLVDVTHKFRR